jgi:hypothetical protein
MVVFTETSKILKFKLMFMISIVMKHFLNPDHQISLSLMTLKYRELIPEYNSFNLINKLMDSAERKVWTEEVINN